MRDPTPRTTIFHDKFLHFALCIFILFTSNCALHLIRHFCLTYTVTSSFYKRVRDLIFARRITFTLNERFAVATAEELTNGDNTCIICRDEMASAIKLTCGHMFHKGCLRTWLEQQQSCPTCRANLLDVEGPAAAAMAAAAVPNGGLPGAPPGAAAGALPPNFPIPGLPLPSQTGMQPVAVAAPFPLQMLFASAPALTPGFVPFDYEQRNAGLLLL